METEFQKWNGLEVKTLVWDIKDGKGFDDYLLQKGESKSEQQFRSFKPFRKKGKVYGTDR